MDGIEAPLEKSPDPFGRDTHQEGDSRCDP